MDDPSLRELLARNQEGLAGASVLSLICGACYAVYKQLDFKKSLLASFTGSLFAASVWLFLSEQWHVGLICFIPVAIVCGFSGFPIVMAYVREDDAIAAGVVATIRAFIARWAKWIKWFGGT